MAVSKKLHFHNELKGFQFPIPQTGRCLRVLLIQPPTKGAVRSFLSQVENRKEGIGFKPPIGLLYLATTLARFSNHEIKVMDCQAQGLDIQSALKEVIRYNPHVVGISAWTDFWYPAFLLGNIIKKNLAGVHLVYGGPHVSIYTQETLDLPFVDSVIAGDGEIPLLCLCNLVAEGKIVNGVRGLHFKPFGVNWDCVHYIQKDHDILPIPARTFLPLELYGSVLSKDAIVTSIITSRGCPYQCVFCRLNFQKTICRSAKSVIDEFHQIQDLGIREVEVYDDTFTWSKKRVIEICRGLIDEGIELQWAIRDRVNKADRDLLRLMYRAGCRRIHYGIESGVDRILERIKKGITTAQAKNAVAWAKETGMTVLTYFMFGNPSETLDDMRWTIEFCLELDADFSEFSITIPYPGTELYNEALSTGLIQNDFWKQFAVNPSPDFIIPQVIEENVDFETLIKIRDEAIRKFYFRPKYLVRSLKKIDSFSELFRKTDMGMHLFLKAFIKKS